jgi:hypothetical protein
MPRGEAPHPSPLQRLLDSVAGYETLSQISQAREETGLPGKLRSLSPSGRLNAPGLESGLASAIGGEVVVKTFSTKDGKTSDVHVSWSEEDGFVCEECSCSGSRSQFRCASVMGICEHLHEHRISGNRVPENISDRLVDFSKKHLAEPRPVPTWVSWGLADEEGRTLGEAEFTNALRERVPNLKVEVWPQVTNGHPWLLVSWNDNLRLDFDGRSIRGGWSPSSLNWDCDVPAQLAGTDTAPPDGIEMLQGTPTELANAAASWFERRAADWWESPRRARWTTYSSPSRSSSRSTSSFLSWFWVWPLFSTGLLAALLFTRCRP